MAHLMCLSIFLLDTRNIQTFSKLTQHRILKKKKKKKVLASQKAAKSADNPNGQCSLQLCMQNLSLWQFRLYQHSQIKSMSRYIQPWEFHQIKKRFQETNDQIKFQTLKFSKVMRTWGKKNCKLLISQFLGANLIIKGD